MATARAFASTTFRSLRTRNYKLFFFGQGASLIGTWAQTIALGWLVLQLSDDSGVAEGLAISLQFLPTLLLSAYGGVIADRFDKRKILIITQAMQAMIAATLGLVVIAGVANLWIVYTMILLFGFAQSIDNPTRLAFVGEMVGPDDLSNAVALNSSLFQVARIIGPVIAGVLIVLIGTGPCFIVNAVSYVGVILALMAMDGAALHRGEPVAKEKGQIRAGFRYVWRTPELRLLLLLTGIVGTLAMNYPVVMPLIAKITFQGGPGVYSVMTIAMGVPALIGGLLIAHRADAGESVLFKSGLCFGAAIIVASLAPTLGIFLLFIMAVGASQIVFMSTCNTMAQLRSDPLMRGRVMSVYVIAVLGSTPIGGPLVGWISQEWGPRYGFAIGGVAAFFGTLVLGSMMLRARNATDDAERAVKSELATASITPLR
jgi:MFS family permease